MSLITTILVSLSKHLLEQAHDGTAYSVAGGWVLDLHQFLGHLLHFRREIFRIEQTRVKVGAGGVARFF
jgi:hypothetical protein